MFPLHYRMSLLGATFLLLAALGPQLAIADSRAEIDAKVAAAQEQLFATVPGASDLAERAFGILIMPDVKKAGLILGGAYGEGALLVDGGTVGYFSVAALSVGFQFGAQITKQALFFMTEDALRDFRNEDGWEVGADAEVTIPGKGVSLGVDSTTAQNPVIGVVFGQDGALLGASLEGAKFSTIVR